MGKDTSIWTIAGIVLCEILLVILIISPAFIQRQTMFESKMTYEMLGEEAGDNIRNRADAWYQTLIIDNHVEEAITHFFIPTEVERANSRGLEDMGSTMWPRVRERISTLMDTIYWMMRRIAMLIDWMPAFAPAFVCAAGHGLLIREIKKTNFQLTSSVVLRYSVGSTKMMITILLLSFFLPLALPPFVVPTIMAAVLFAVGMSLSNIAKRI